MNGRKGQLLQNSDVNQAEAELKKTKGQSVMGRQDGAEVITSKARVSCGV